MVGTTGIIVWLIAAIILSVIEGVTVQLVSIWFAIGTIPAMIVAGLGGELWLQLIVFLITSILVLLIGRPLLSKKISHERHATNADRVIGMTGIVTEEIDNLHETGRVMANGLGWSAKTKQSGEKVPVDTRVLVLGIDGVKLVVEPLEENEVGKV